MSSVLVPKAGIQTIVPFPVESHLRCGSIPFAKAFLHDHRLTRVHNAFSRTENLAVTKARAREWTATPLHMAACTATAALILQPEFKRNLVCGQARSGQTACGRPPKGIEVSAESKFLPLGIPPWDSIRVPFHLAQDPDPVIPGGTASAMRPVTFAKALFHAHSFPVGLPVWRKS